jgi:hypothetical protein
MITPAILCIGLIIIIAYNITREPSTYRYQQKHKQHAAHSGCLDRIPQLVAMDEDVLDTRTTDMKEIINKIVTIPARDDNDLMVSRWANIMDHPSADDQGRVIYTSMTADTFPINVADWNDGIVTNRWGSNIEGFQADQTDATDKANLLSQSEPVFSYSKKYDWVAAYADDPRQPSIDDTFVRKTAFADHVDDALVYYAPKHELKKYKLKNEYQ